jgi:hypothetical protein
MLNKRHLSSSKLLKGGETGKQKGFKDKEIEIIMPRKEIKLMPFFLMGFAAVILGIIYGFLFNAIFNVDMGVSLIMMILIMILIIVGMARSLRK